jgi:hypothetical protein
MRNNALLLLFICLISTLGLAQTDSLSTLARKLKQMDISAYGAMNFYHFDWQTDSIKRDAIDNERFIVDFEYRWNSDIKFKAELEIEHGGVGADVEFDRFEEFGEFEFDITKGGEVLLEQLQLVFRLKPKHQLQVGRIKVPFGLMFSRDEPTDYLTALNSEAETMILPENWTENGVALSGAITPRLNYHLAVVNGLDNSAFNSANWIKRGNQRRFEMARAENMAIVCRIDYKRPNGFSTGVSFYGSNTTGNRPKPDLTVPVYLGIADWHFSYKKNILELNGLVFGGHMTNTEALTNQNRNLSNNLNVKRTPVGEQAVGAFLETGITVWGNTGIWNSKSNTTKKVILFSRYDYYDTMLATEGAVFDNPRWERSTWSFGAVYQVIEPVHFKLQYASRTVGAPAPTSINGGTLEQTWIAGFAFKL